MTDADWRTVLDKSTLWDESWLAFSDWLEETYGERGAKEAEAVRWLMREGKRPYFHTTFATRELEPRWFWTRAGEQRWPFNRQVVPAYCQLPEEIYGCLPRQCREWITGGTYYIAVFSDRLTAIAEAVRARVKFLEAMLGVRDNLGRIPDF